MGALFISTAHSRWIERTATTANLQQTKRKITSPSSIPTPKHILYMLFTKFIIILNLIFFFRFQCIHKCAQPYCFSFHHHKRKLFSYLYSILYVYILLYYLKCTNKRLGGVAFCTNGVCKIFSVYITSLQYSMRY